MPKWINPASQFTRSNTTLTMNYYTALWGNDVGFILKNTKGEVIEQVEAKTICTLNNVSHEPFFKVITAGKTTEIIEHKKMEPIFYVTDDPVVRHHYLVNGCK